MELEAEIEIEFKFQLLTERRHFCALGLMPRGALPGEEQAGANLPEIAMKIESLMHRDVRAARPWDSALDALRSMWEGDCGALPVVDAGGRVTGIVTDRDLAMASLLRGQALSELQVDEVASRPVVACLEDGSLSVVHALMRRHQLRRLPVIDARGRLVGIVTLADVLRNALDDPRPGELRETLETACAIHERRSVGPACALPAHGRELEGRREAAMAQVVRDRQCDLEC